MALASSVGICADVPPIYFVHPAENYRACELPVLLVLVKWVQRREQREHAKVDSQRAEPQGEVAIAPGLPTELSKIQSEKKGKGLGASESRSKFERWTPMAFEEERGLLKMSSPGK